MNTLVTGCEGFLGRVLVKKLKERGRYVIGIDKKRNLFHHSEVEPDIFINGDVRDKILREIVTEEGIDEIYHLASWAIQKHCAADPKSAFDNNINGLLNVLETCRNVRHNIESIVISTSDKAFGEAPVPYNENSPLQPLFIYDTSKACQQLISLAYARNYNLPIKIVACSNLYGPGDFNTTRIIPNSIVRLTRDLPIRIWKDSESHVREFVYIDDAADGFITVSERGRKGEVYCCGGDEHLKIKDLAEKICIMMGKDPKKYIKLAERPIYLHELKEQFMNSSKLRSLGWIPKFSLDEGLKKSIEFYTKLANEGKIHPTRFEEDGSITGELEGYFSG
ncbi:MAG: CDP-glucose 4,6-dehydratase [Candidatus Parcubacteria bacterium]|nr:MAG: CDP-glucose 4,6-dehydratase [Candidatus Pacearchaeota archaeon]GIW65362.1 MAG: CDP-glucose 4,6-dehydratase [Candidatus Parcubacteria bacterium]